MKEGHGLWHLQHVRHHTALVKHMLAPHLRNNTLESKHSLTSRGAHEHLRALHVQNAMHHTAVCQALCLHTLSVLNSQELTAAGVTEDSRSAVLSAEKNQCAVCAWQRI